jgi:hypothetical protein
MADLNIRNVDETLLAQLKSEAALLGFNLKSYIVGILVMREKPSILEERKAKALEAVRAAAHPSWRKSKDKEYARSVENAALVERLEDPTLQHYPPAYNYTKPDPAKGYVPAKYRKAKDG